MKTDKETLLKLRQELERILSLRKDYNLYSAMDLITLKQKEARDQLNFFDTVKDANPTISDLSMTKFTNGIAINIDFLSYLHIKRLMLMYYFTSDTIAFAPDERLRNAKKVILSPLVAEKLKKEYYDVILELVNYGRSNLSTDERIPTNSMYLNLFLERGDKILSIKDDMELNALFNLVFYFDDMHYFNNVDEELLGNYRNYFRKLLYQSPDNLRLLLENLQFSGQDISEDLNNQLIKKLSR